MSAFPFLHEVGSPHQPEAGGKYLTIQTWMWDETDGVRGSWDFISSLAVWLGLGFCVWSLAACHVTHHITVIRRLLNLTTLLYTLYCIVSILYCICICSIYHHGINISLSLSLCPNCWRHAGADRVGCAVKISSEHWTIACWNAGWVAHQQSLPRSDTLLKLVLGSWCHMSVISNSTFIILINRPISARDTTIW